MNLGTASDVRDIKGVIAEIRRVLKPGGRFFLSFYNREALAYRWEFIPWPLGLVASVNIYKHCLEVHDPTKGGKMSVYAQAYTTKEVEELLAGSDDLRLITYPAISAITPSVLFENQPDAEGTFEAVDRTLLDSNMGAYIIATGAKPL
jgi:SAM-dependent methyltransferase